MLDYPHSAQKGPKVGVPATPASSWNVHAVWSDVYKSFHAGSSYEYGATTRLSGRDYIYSISRQLALLNDIEAT
jgi:hypothetical protein